MVFLHWVPSLPPIFFDLFFLISPFRSLEMKLLGGVTLNHLSWAALAGGEGTV